MFINHPSILSSRCMQPCSYHAAREPVSCQQDSWLRRPGHDSRKAVEVTEYFQPVRCYLHLFTVRWILQCILAHFLTRTRGLGTDGQLICASLFLILASLYLGPRDPMLTENMCCLALTISVGWNATWWGLLGGLHHSGGPASSWHLLLWNAQVIVSKYPVTHAIPSRKLKGNKFSGKIRSFLTLQ